MPFLYHSCFGLPNQLAIEPHAGKKSLHQKTLPCLDCKLVQSNTQISNKIYLVIFIAEDHIFVFQELEKLLNSNNGSQQNENDLDNDMHLDFVHVAESIDTKVDIGIQCACTMTQNISTMTVPWPCKKSTTRLVGLLDVYSRQHSTHVRLTQTHITRGHATCHIFPILQEKLQIANDYII